ncbi:Mobile element protein [Bacillus subtilis]|nr:Mobile element protein [Bacillus subtilis]
MKKEPPFGSSGSRENLGSLYFPIARFGFQVEAVAFDSGYLTTPISKGLSDCDIFGEIAHRRYILP